MTCGIAKVQQAAFGQQDDAVALRELDHVDLRLDVRPLEVTQRCDLNFIVEMADIADDGHVLHLAHMLDADHVLVACRGDEDICRRDDVFQANDFETVHGSLKRADRVDFGDLHAGAGALQRSGRTLAHIAVTADHGNLAGHHHVGCAANAVDERFLAAILVVELRLGDAVVDVDGREGQQALLAEIVKTVNAGRRFFCDTLQRVALFGEPAGGSLEALVDLREEDFLFFRTGIGQNVLAGFSTCAEQDIHGGVAAIVKDHVGEAAIGPLEDPVGIFPIFRQAFTLDREDRNAGRRNCRRRMILRRENVAGGPANIRAQFLQRLDENAGLDRHVKRTGDTSALQGLAFAEFLAAGHQARHFGFGNVQLLAAERGKVDIGDDVVLLKAHKVLQIRNAAPDGPALKRSSGLAGHERSGNNDIKKSLCLYMALSQASSPKRSATSASSAASASAA
ncbi:hypothetical protein D3C71_638490 [compost metagenome]